MFYSCGFPLQPGLSQLARRVAGGGSCIKRSGDVGCIPTVFVIELTPGGDASVAIFPSELSLLLLFVSNDEDIFLFLDL